MSPSAVVIRPAAETDASAMLEIYRPYVERTAISFETEVPSVEEYTSRVCKYLASWAVVVAEVDDQFLGFAYGSAHRERLAYQWSTETTVYLAQGAHRAGTGSKLYAELLPRLANLGYCNAYAGVALPNLASVGLHQAVGFKPIGTFPRVGHKFGRWHDVAWFHLTLRDSAPLSPGAKGLALGPRGYSGHHPPRGPSANPAVSAQLKR
jgi:L-amino acid N-acyltransferase YncA